MKNMNKGKHLHFLCGSLAVIAALAGPSLAQTRTGYELGGVTARVGEKASGFMQVPAGRDDATQIPLTIFQGAKEGKVLLIIAGVHGSEYVPVLALQNLAKKINPKELSGTVILVHVANLPSFLKRTIYYGADGKNLNRVFPGKADGTISERIAYVLTEQLMKRADYIIDVHCGDNNESLRPYTGFTKNALSTKEFVETSARMARAMGIDFIKVATGRSMDFNMAAYSTNAAALLGKPSIAIESGELGKPHMEDVRRIDRGLLNVMRALEMLPGKVVRFKNQTFIKRDQTLRSTTTGLFYSLIVKNQRVKERQLLGYVTDYFGNRVQEVRAPFTGVVMYYTATPPVSIDEPLVNLGEIETRK